MGQWVDYSERLLLNPVPVEKKTPLPSEDIIEKLKACLNDPDDEPWLESTLKAVMPESDRRERVEKCYLGEHLKEIDREYEKERKESMNTNRIIPEVKLIQRRGRCTIVKWEDGTQTKVVLEEGKPDTGIFGAYCIALAKKCAGSTEKLLRTIDDHDERAMKCRHQARVQELREEHLKNVAKARKDNWERDVAAAMYDSRVRDEAIKRLWAMEEKEDI